MLLHNPAKLPPIDRFEKLPKNAIYAAHARPLSESRQPESIQFVLDLPGMRCGIVNHSPDSPARLRGEGWGEGLYPRVLCALIDLYPLTRIARAIRPLPASG